MTITISPQHEALLKEVVSSGYYTSQEEALTEAIRLLREQMSNGSPGEADLLPPDEWIEEFHKWTGRRRVGNPNLDDSRESIYEGRGE